MEGVGISKIIVFAWGNARTGGAFCWSRVVVFVDVSCSVFVDIGRSYSCVVRMSIRHARQLSD